MLNISISTIWIDYKYIIILKNAEGSSRLVSESNLWILTKFNHYE